MEPAISIQTIVAGVGTTILLAVILIIATFILIGIRGNEMREEINAIFQKAIRKGTDPKPNRERYYLFTWPESQEFVGRKGCHLIDPSKAPNPWEDPNEFDSSYMVPESLLLSEEHDGIPLYGHPFVMDGPVNADSISDYDGNVFNPVNP